MNVKCPQFFFPFRNIIIPKSDLGSLPKDSLPKSALPAASNDKKSVDNDGETTPKPKPPEAESRAVVKVENRLLEMDLNRAVQADNVRLNEFNQLYDKIENDTIEASYVTSTNSHLVIATSNAVALCYKMPLYEQRWIIDIKIDNRQISRIMKAFQKSNIPFDVESSCNTFEKNWITCIATSQQADILVVAFIDGYMNLINTGTKDIMHIVQAHVDAITFLTFTKSDVLVTGGMDSNVKVWKNLKQESVSSEYTFMKHTDKISFVRSYHISDKEYVLSCDNDGVAYYWEIGSFKAEKYILIDENSLIEGNSHLIYSICIEHSCVVLKKYSFAQREVMQKIVLRYFDGFDDLSIRATLGFSDSEIFQPKLKAYIKIAKNILVIWLRTTVVEFFDIDKLTKLYEVKLSVVPNTIKVTTNLNDIILFYK